MHDFYLTLPSNTSTENTTANFSVHLPNKLELQGKWEVALVEIQYPHSWDNIHSSDGSGQLDNVLEVTFANGSKVAVHIPPGYYGTIEELIKGIKYGQERTSQMIAVMVKNQKFKRMKMFHITDIVKGFHFEWNETLKRVKCKLYHARIQSVKLSQQLQYMLGFETDTIDGSNEMAYFQPDLRSGFYSLYIYCSLVEPQIVGNITAPLIRHVHINGSHGDIVEKLYQTPHYVPVIAKEVDRIEIDIKDDKNQSVPFQFGKTVVKLHFRKKHQLL